jgi:hypothetical protein
MGEACSTNGEKRSVYRLLVGNPKGKSLLGRPRRRWVNNDKMDLGEIGWCGVDWIELTQDRGQLESFCDFRDETLVFMSHGTRKKRHSVAEVQQFTCTSLLLQEQKVAVLPVAEL